MKKTITLFLTIFGLFSTNAQETFNPRNLDHELTIDTEFALSKTLGYLVSNPDPNYYLLLKKSGEIGVGLNYKHKVIQKGNYFMHFGFNYGAHSYNYNVPITSNINLSQKIQLNRNKFRMGFSKEFFILKDKLVLEPCLFLTYLTFNFDTQRYESKISDNNNSNSEIDKEYGYNLELETEKLRRIHPQLQLNLNYQILNKIYLGLNVKTGLYELLPYKYDIYETTHDNQNMYSSTFGVTNRLNAVSKNLYFGLNLTFKY